MIQKNNIITILSCMIYGFLIVSCNQNTYDMTDEYIYTVPYFEQDNLLHYLKQNYRGELIEADPNQFIDLRNRNNSKYFSNRNVTLFSMLSEQLYNQNDFKEIRFSRINKLEGRDILVLHFMIGIQSPNKKDFSQKCYYIIWINKLHCNCFNIDKHTDTIYSNLKLNQIKYVCKEFKIDEFKGKLIDANIKNIIVNPIAPVDDIKFYAAIKFIGFNRIPIQYYESYKDIK